MQLTKLVLSLYIISQEEDVKKLDSTDACAPSQASWCHDHQVDQPRLSMTVLAKIITERGAAT
jgi:hypothetical protein